MTIFDVLPLLKKAETAYVRFCRPLCKKYGLNQSCVELLYYLAKNAEHNTARDICELRGAKSGIVSVSVETLIGLDYIVQVDDEFDRRVKRLVLTEKAKPLVDELLEVRKSFGEAVSAGIAQPEIEFMRSIAAKIAENVKNIGKEPILYD